METITFTNQKGGVGKTTSASAICSGLADRNQKVLAIDLDPQGNLSLSSGVDLLDLESTVYDVFKRKVSIKSAIKTSSLGYDVLAGGLSLAGADMDFTQTGREYMLSEALQDIKNNYDTIIIDTPPTLGILTINALTASDCVIIPMLLDVYSLQGLSQLNGLIGNVKKYCNHDLNISGILITKYNSRQNLSKALMQRVEQAAENIGTKVFDTKIRESVAIREAALIQGDIFKEAPKANATIDYGNFINEYFGKLD